MMLAAFFVAWLWVVSVAAYQGYQVAKVFGDVMEGMNLQENQSGGIRLDGSGDTEKKRFGRTR